MALSPLGCRMIARSDASNAVKSVAGTVASLCISDVSSVNSISEEAEVWRLSWVNNSGSPADATSEEPATAASETRAVRCMRNLLCVPAVVGP